MTDNPPNNRPRRTSKAASHRKDAGTLPSANRAPRYAVGYARPPKASQFKPGVSGNPRGRPKGSQSLRAKLANVLTSKIVKREGDKKRTITAMEGMVWKQVESGLKGNERAVLSAFKLASALGLLEKIGGADDGPSLSRTEQDLVDELLSKFPKGPIED